MNDLNLFADKSSRQLITDRAIKFSQASGIFMGTSSWKYGGWQGLVYHRHYKSKHAFQAQCLNEYAKYFPAVGVDATFYRCPSKETLQDLAAQTHDHFKFGLKATEEITVYKYPTHPRYGQRKGLVNPNFLNADLFLEKFVEPATELGPKLGPIMLQFASLPPKLISEGSFLNELNDFLARLPSELQFATEIRNRQLFNSEYFDVLRSHNIAHVHSSWSFMPPFEEQIANQSSFTGDFFAMRLLTPYQMEYSQAVETFFPYSTLQKPQPKVRNALIKQLNRAMGEQFPGYVFINNRLEGASPITINEVLASIIEGNPSSEF